MLLHTPQLTHLVDAPVFTIDRVMGRVILGLEIPVGRIAGIQHQTLVAGRRLLQRLEVPHVEVRLLAVVGAVDILDHDGVSVLALHEPENAVPVRVAGTKDLDLLATREAAEDRILSSGHFFFPAEDLAIRRATSRLRAID